VEDGGGLGNGYRVEFATHLLLAVAAGLAAVALARSGRYRLAIGVLRRGRSRLVVLLGAAGSLALLLHVMRLTEIGPKSYWIAPPVWLTGVTLVALLVVAVLDARAEPAPATV
jgi:hypothetical protein